MTEYAYKPEYDYKDTNYKPLGKHFTNDMCKSCKHYYKDMFDKGLTKSEFPVQCQGHIMDQVNALRIEEFDSEEEFEEAKIVLDPVSWALQEFNWDHRWYQNWVSSCTANKKVLRGGRRCLAKDTLIKTTRGDVFIQDIVVGDYVYSEYNKPVQVTRTFDQGLQEVVDIGNVVDGKLATCTLDHRWLGKSSKDIADDSKWYVEPSIIETRDLYEEDYKAVGHIEYVEDNYKLGHVSYIENKRLEQCYDIEVDSPTSLYCLANGLVTHNSGKSRVEIILVLHEMMTLSNRRILLLCPSEKLIGEFFEVIDEFIKNSTNLKNSIDRATKNPHMIKLKNGSKLLGISISPKDPDAGDKARGFDAHLFIIDESEMFKEKDMESIMALLVSNPETRVMVSSTPKGWRKTFYRTCTNKNLGYKEFWWISAEKPDWSTQMETALRDEFTAAAYTHEFDADFGELEEGVFKKKYIDSALYKYDMNDIAPTPAGRYVLGVDWNKSAGNHMVIVEVEGRHLKLVQKIVVPDSEFMQTQSIQDIIDLHAKWHFKYIFVDAGYGHVSCELLKKYGVANPLTRLAEIVHPIKMNENLQITNPVDGSIVKKFAKPYLVDQTIKLLEDGCLVLPVSEDYGAAGENKHDVGLVEQMRNYKVENYSVYSLPRYSQGADHTLTAYMLACGMWVKYEGPLKNLAYSQRVMTLPIATHSPRPEPSATEAERNKELSTTINKLANSSGRVNTNRKSYRTRDLDALMRKNPNSKRVSWEKGYPRRTSF